MEDNSQVSASPVGSCQLLEDGESEQQGNVILRDWFSFTSKTHSPQELIAAMGLSSCPWQESEKGAHGYRDRLYFGCISVHYNGRDDMGVWVEMTGQGCRTFEDFTNLPNKWDDLTAFVLDNCLHVTRLDVAYDDHTGVLDMDRILDDIEDQRYVSPSRFWESVRSSQGKSSYIGSPRSIIRIRIYDKAAERGFEDGRHWIRVELQLRDDRAEKMLRLTGEGLDGVKLTVGQAFSGVLMNYLRFVQPSDSDSNKSRWEISDYWDKLLGDVEAISLWSATGGVYNLARCANYSFNIAGNAVACMVDMLGTAEFMYFLKHRACNPNPKYKLITADYRANRQKTKELIRELLQIDEEEEYIMIEREGKIWENSY